MGKPSAPVKGLKGYPTEFGFQEGVEGLTIRQYFMAHAPAEPQAWFKPVIGERPKTPIAVDELTPEQYMEWENAEKDPEDPRVLAFIKEEIVAQMAQRAYDAEYVKQTYALWPAAWADAVLAAGEK